MSFEPFLNERKVKKYIQRNAKLHIIEINELTNEMKNFIDSRIINITNGTRKINLKIVKDRIKKFLASKNEKTKKGIVAEFFTHLYLSSEKYKQECLFKNLEENSVKKGFDGFYSKDSEKWIMESKSGSKNTKNNSHQSKIKEAYNDLNNKLTGKTSNNPWENAYYHAIARNVNNKQEIVKYIEKLSEDFEKKKFCNIEKFNIIPSATIFLDNDWIDDNSNKAEAIEAKISELIDRKKITYQKIEIICFTKKSLNLFLEYLEE